MDRYWLLALQRATHAVGRHLAAVLVDLDLSASELNALANLADGTARTVSRLGSVALGRGVGDGSAREQGDGAGESEGGQHRRRAVAGL